MLRVFCLMACAALTGCGGGESVVPGGLPARQVRVDWMGHESFLFRSSLGTKILTNPFESGTGGRTLPAGLRPDIILVSTEQPDTNNVDAADNTPAIFRGAVALGPNNANGIRIRGVATYKTPGKEEVLDMNIVFSWTLDGVRFCFAGNIAHPLSVTEMSQIGPVDVLFLPVGIPAGLTEATRQILISQLRPRVIIPMGHAAEISGWAAGFSNVHRVPGSSVLLSREALPAGQTVVILAPP
ncbi:MAG: MBL fold metallo-hydrolase [Verrucomicrobiota bacterium]